MKQNNLEQDTRDTTSEVTNRMNIKVKGCSMKKGSNMEKKKKKRVRIKINEPSLSQKLCDLSARHKGFLALMVTTIAALGVTICGLLLIAFGTSSVASYYHTLRFIKTSCEVTNSTLTNERMECSCRDVCRSTFPCLLIQVKFNLQDNSTTATSTMHHTDIILNKKCSYEPKTPCSESSDENERNVKDFYENYGQLGQNYSCLYNPENPAEVIVNRAASKSEIITMLLWPALFLLIGVAIIVATHYFVGARHICDMFKIVNKTEAPIALKKKTGERKFRRICNPV